MWYGEYELTDIAHLYPFEMYAEYEDGYSCYIYDEDEESAMCEVAKLMDHHGECTYYTGVENEDRTNGEWVGRENYIYSYTK